MESPMATQTMGFCLAELSRSTARRRKRDFFMVLKSTSLCVKKDASLSLSKTCGQRPFAPCIAHYAKVCYGQGTCFECLSMIPFLFLFSSLPNRPHLHLTGTCVISHDHTLCRNHALR